MQKLKTDIINIDTLVCTGWISKFWKAALAECHLQQEAQPAHADGALPGDVWTAPHLAGHG